MDTKGIGLSVTITEVSVLQTRSCMTLGNFETTQTVRLSVSVRVCREGFHCIIIAIPG